MYRLRAGARLCRALGAEPALQRTLRRPAAALAPSTAPRGNCTLPVAAWQPSLQQQQQQGAGGGRRPGFASLLRPHRGLRTGPCWQARAFTRDDIQADVGVMVEGEPAGVR